MKRKITVSSVLILLFSVVAINAQIVDDPFAAPLYMDVHCDAPNDAQVRVHISPNTSGYTIFGEDIDPLALDDHVYDCAPLRTTSGFVLDDPLCPEVIPGEEYYVHAMLSEDQTTPVNIELMFDVPDGYRLYVDGFEQDHLAEEISSSRRWSIIIDHDNADFSPTPGSYRGPYFGSKYIFDFSLGSMQQGFDAGLLRIDREKFENGYLDRSLISGCRRFSELKFVYDSGSGDAPLRQVYIEEVGLLVDLVDTTNGFTITYYDAPSDMYPNNYDADPETPDSYTTSGLTEIRTWTITENVTENGTDTFKILDLVSDEDGIIWEAQIELASTSSDTWYFRSGKLSEGNWLRELKCQDTALSAQEDGDWKRTVSIGGTEDLDLDGAQDTGESISFQTVREDIYEEIQAYESSNNVNRIIRRKLAPGTTDEEITEYTYITSDAGSKGKISTITYSTGLTETRTYYVQESDAAKRCRGRLKSIETDRPVAFNSDAVTSYDADAVKKTSFEWGTEQSAGFFDYRIAKKTESISNGSTEYTVGEFERDSSELTGGVREHVTRERLDGSIPERYHEVVTQYRPTDTLVAPGRVHARRDSFDEIGAYYTYIPGDYNTSTDTFTINLDGDELLVIQTNGIIDEQTGTVFNVPDLRAGQSRQIESFISEDGKVLRKKTYCYMGSQDGWELIGDLINQYDSLDNLVYCENVLTEIEETYTYQGHRLITETKDDGLEFTFDYDALGRKVRITREELEPTWFGADQPSVTHGEMFKETVWDPRGNKRISRRTGTPDEGVSQEIATTITYNLADKEIERTDLAGNATSISRTLSSVGGEGWIVTKTASDGTQTQTTYYDDGREKKIVRAGGPTSYYHYGVASDGALTTLVRSGADTSNVPYAHTETNWNGKVVKKKAPALNDSATLGNVTERISMYEYDLRGRLLKLTQTGKPTVRYEYGDPGVSNFTTRSWTDLDDDGVFDSTIEPAQEVHKFIQLISHHAWECVRKSVYDKSGSATAIPVSETRKRLTGFPYSVMSETQNIQYKGSDTVTTINKIRFYGDQRIQEVSVPTGSNSYAVTNRYYIHGRIYREEDPLGRAMRYSYDELGRQVEMTDFDGVTHKTVYQNNSSRVDYEQSGAENLQTGYSYYDGTASVGSMRKVEYRFVISESHSAYGSSSSLVNPAALDPNLDDDVVSVERFVYDSSGRIDETYSAGIKRTESTYDTYGRKDTFKVFQNVTVSSMVDWDYNSSTGQLVARKDTNPSGTGLVTESYRYHPSGDLYQTVDPRGVEITYTYGDSSDGYGYGKLTQTEFDDVDYAAEGIVSTPSITRTYNRFNAIATLDNGVTGLNTYTYNVNATNPTLDLVEIGFDNSFYCGEVDSLELLYENENSTNKVIGRSSGFNYLEGSTVVAGEEYGYDQLGRRYQITAKGFWGQSDLEDTTIGIGYDSSSGRRVHVKSPLIAMSNGTYKQTLSWDTEGRLVETASGHDGDNDGLLDPTDSNDLVNARYRYTFDSAGRREWERADGFMFDRYSGSGLSTKFTYDGSGRLSEADSYYGLVMSESADPVTGRGFSYSYDAAGNRTSRSVDGTAYNYGVSASQTYTSKENPGFNVYSGMAGTSVKIGGVSPAVLYGDYYWHDKSVSNQSTAVWDQATVSYSIQSSTIGAVVPAQAQNFTFDEAGNLLADGIWSYQYDAMNRLRVMERETISGLPTAQDLRLEFEYDEQNRRVEKTVKDRSTGTVQYRERYLYSGWNLVAILDVEGVGATQSASLKTRFVWSTDSSSSGAMGLAMIAGDHDDDDSSPRRAFIPGYDARGNLTSLAENRLGNLGASFEYSPFGELLRSQGTAMLPDLRSLGAYFGFATQFADPESGLVYFGQRYYHPGMGRFITRDPLKEDGGNNHYVYAKNDPINWTDYRGLCPEEPPYGGWNKLAWYYDQHNSVTQEVFEYMQATAGFKELEAKRKAEEAANNGSNGNGSNGNGSNGNGSNGNGSNGNGSNGNGSNGNGSNGNGSNGQGSEAASNNFESNVNDVVSGLEETASDLGEFAESIITENPIGLSLDTEATSVTVPPSYQETGNIVDSAAQGGQSSTSSRSGLGNALRHVPILGGVLGGIGDAVSGLGNIAIGNFGTGISQIGAGIGRTAGHVWAFPNTAVGLVYGGTGMLFGATPVWNSQDAILYFKDMPDWLMPSAMSLGHVHVYNSNYFGGSVITEETLHTRQAEILGPLYLPLHGISMGGSIITSGDTHKNNPLEWGPQSNRGPWP